MATIHVFRTAETQFDAEPKFRNARDSSLSEKGLEQCMKFSCHSGFLPLMQHVTHVVSSPLCSSLYSCRIAFDRIVSSKTIIVRPELMDVGCPTPSFGSDKMKLFLMFGEQVNLDALPNGWEDIDPSSEYAHYDLQKIKARTSAGRRWLMDLARTAGEKAHIVVMTHGQTAHLLTDDFQGVEPPYSANWDGDLSWRSYKFDFAAEKMVETPSSRVRRGVSADINTFTEDENDRIRAMIEDRIEKRAPLVQAYQAEHCQIEATRYQVVT
ncbi:uncharacterized protein F4807DRAFT_463962 [Annulohypoxylon truncatum]|uniref:uncharacterized protein n=1 Tax=Annulohypoxylon truncatum TaxID=327061 RepID=UPI0020084705|nr:uncharacterized protein F4807DRAFT_463962 [Annulohypoxylon truncatum]KAI1206197.1 hypothetical protein F4807DRAFT_463962 [Annulohypoxylon truncatum]